MAVKVKWTGNAADLPHPQETNKKPTVRYVGTGEGGVTYQPSVTVKTKTSEDADSGGVQNKKFDAGQYAGDAGKLFINGVAEGFAATGAAAENWIGKGLDKLFPGAGFEGSGLFNALYNGRPDWKWAGENGLVGIKQDREYNQESLQENAEHIDSKVLKKAAEFGGDIAYGLGNAAPMAATAMATGGASAAASLTKEGLMKTGAEVVEKSGVLNSLSQAAREMLTSQDYWTSFASEVGMDYYDALDNGATEDEALRYALSSAGLNSVIEIGGGIQKIPKKPTFKTWLKSAHEEGMEEIQQGVVSRLLENVVYNKGNPIASVTDENAVLNPVTALGEYAGGAVVGGILSGGQQLVQRGINDARYRKTYGNTAQDLVNESLELNPDNALAKKAQEKLDAGKKLTGSELRQLVEQNETNMVDGDRERIQSAAEDRLTELGETENVPQVAEAIARQAAGEAITADEKTLLESSERARQVRQELNPENIRVGAANEEWTGQIGTARVNRAAYNRGIQENGVTGAKYNAETGKLDVIVKDDQGKIKTVPAEQAELSPLQEELFDWAADLGEAGPVLVSAYRESQNLDTYARQFHNAYEYGKAGVPMDYVNRSQAVSYLNETQREIAYEEGAKAHQREVQGRQEKKRSGGTVDSTKQKKPSVSLRGATVGGVKYAAVNKKAMDGRQWASVGTMKAFAQATGVNVVFYESQANERGEYEGANGFFKDGTLYLDINAGRDRVALGETAILKTAAHEITHYIKEGSPEQYEILKNFVVEKLTQQEGLDFDDLVTDKQRREPGLFYEEAVDEVVADACEMMLKDSKAVEQLARENRSLAERIRQWIRKWVRSLKAAMEGLRADRPESRAMMQYAQELQEIWDNALVDAARNGRGAVETDSRAQASARKKYWRPDLSENEWRLLERRMDEEIGSRENFLDEATKWVYANEKGVQVFALYGIGDGTDATPLYAVGGEKAAAAAADMQKFVNGGYRYDKGTGTALSRIRGFLRTQGDGSGDIRETSRGRSTGTDDALYGGERKGNAGKSVERGSENQREVKEKFSMREPVEETRDLIALHNMTLDNLRGALKLGGLPMPSIAIVKASAGHSKYGPISVVFEKNTIDPQADRRNKVYGGDAYTPTAPQVEYPVRYEAMQRVEKHIAELSEQVAGGIFRNDTALRRLGIDSESSMDTEALADRLSRDDSVQAAYLADAGKKLEPVRKLKEFSRYGNGALQQLVSEIGVQELARINAEMEAGNYDVSTDAEKAVRDIIRSAYEVKHRSFLDRKPELKQQRIDKYMENNVSRMTVEDFVRDAWEFYQDNGATTDEVDRWATADKLHEAVNPADVKKWLLGQLDGVLGEAGIYNGKERYTPSGNERSFAQTHYAYTLENIVRVMSQTQEERGGQTFGVTAKSMQAVSTPSYGSIAEIKSDSGRLGAVEGDIYDAAVEKVEKQIEQVTRRVMRENKPHSDNQFEETQIIGEVMMESAKESKTEAAIRKVFQREGYSVSKETIGAMQSMFRAAAQLPTEYFEAKPQRAIHFDEAAAVVVPDNIPAELKQSLEKQGATIREYKAGDEQSRLEAVNADERILFQQREQRLSDRVVLEWAAEMALRDKNKNWTAEDREQLDRFRNRMRMLQDTQAELEALKEERKDLLAGRKASEIKGEERTELTRNKNRIDIAKNKAERYEAAVWELESKAAIKTLLRKSRSIVETEASYQARKEYRERQEEREMVNVTRRKVERNAKRLLEYMNTNTDKKHIPEALKKPIGELLESLNFYSNSARRGGYTSRADMKYYEAMQGLQAALAKQKAFDDTGEGTDVFKGYLDLPAGFESLLAVHLERVKNVMEKHPLKTDVVRAMDLEDLRDLDVILSVVSRSVTKMNEMFIKRRFAYVADAAEDSIITMQRLGQHQDKLGEQFALWDNTLPWYAFQRFGEGGKAVFEGLQDGWDKLAFNMKTILDFRQGLISDALARKWDTETHKVELTDPDGSTVTATLTTAQLMSLRCLSKRKQALGHLLGGGIRPDAIEVANTLGDKIKKKKWNQDKQFKLTEESLGQLLKLLTPEQIKVADVMQKFMTEQGSAWGNAISMARFGYRAFTEQNYFPIETDRQDREAKTGDAKEGSLYRLQNISAVKPLVKDANNALILRGIFDVFANHTADMAKYNALVLPIIDAQKWYNYRYGEKNEAGQVSTRTVQRAMTKAYGEVANNFVIKYLQDLNGVKENGDRGDTIPKRMISNYKRAMVAANMRVAILQPTAYARASAVLDYKYLAKAFADKTGTKQATREMLENSGIALWKSLGFFDTDVGRSIRDQIKGKSSKIEDLVDKTMVPAEKGDEVTWARLWRACKLEVQDKQHLAGEELLKATAERFREVVYRTQVVDSTMTRSHAMRGSGTLTKMATSFMSEPTVSYNMVMESTRQIAEDAKRMGLRPAIRRNWKTAGRAYQAYIVSAVVTAIVESLYDALRDSDDDKYLDKVWKALGGEKPETVKDGILDVIFGLNGNLAGDINPIGKVPYLRDVVSILGGYSNGRMDTEAVANLKKAIDIWDEVIRLQTGDLDKATKTTYYGNMTTYGMIYPTAKALSQLTGLPGSAAMREVATAWNTTVGTMWPALKMRTYEDKKIRKAWEEYGKDSGVSYATMYRAIQDMREFESDRDAEGNAISGSLKAKYVDYIQELGLTQAQEKAVWEAAKNSSWSDKGTPWG